MAVESKKDKKNNPAGESPVTSLDMLSNKLSDIAAEAKIIENSAEVDGRSLTTEEVSKLKELKTQFAEVEQEISARESIQEMNAKIAQPGRRQTQPEPLAAAADDDGGEERPRPAMSIVGGAPSGSTKGNWGFTRGLGEFVVAARKSKNGGQLDQRIRNAPTSYGQEAVGADGGFAVPPDFRAEIMKKVQGEESLLSRTDQQVTSGNSLVLPQDNTTPWQTSGGVIASWTGEGASINGSKPALGQMEVKLNKLTALVPITSELAEDVTSMNRYLSSKVPEKFTSAINTAIVSGSGVGQPLGLLNSAALVTQAAESGQGSGTVVAKNILNMMGRFYAALRNGAAWLINQDVEPQLQQLVMPGTNPSFPAYMPPGGFSQSPYSTLLGLPVIPVEACAQVGTVGDIILTNLKQYCSAVKSGGMRAEASMHLYFDLDMMAFRFVLRLGGQPYWAAPIVRQNSTNTVSSIVALNSSRT